MRLIQRLIVGTTAVLALTSLVASPASAAGDDYPYRTSTSNALDRWGFTQRQCVSFVAWREAQAGHALDNGSQRWGSALYWDEAAVRLGVKIGTRPIVGAIAHWNAGERSPWWANGSPTANGYIQAGPYGHVGWVKQVNSDGSVVVEQYNMSGNRSYSLTRVKAPRYLYNGVGGYPAARRY
jgi:surface antigen